MYMTFASIFIAQIYGIDMTVGQQITMLFSVNADFKRNCRSSKSEFGDYCRRLVSMFGIPPEGIALILPIDHFCDMGRSMTNVLGKLLQFLNGKTHLQLLPFLNGKDSSIITVSYKI